MMHDERELLRVFLHERDVRCPVCGYNLRGVGGERCPECGARLDLRVGSIDIRMGAWLLAVFSIALPMGFTVIFLIIALIGSMVALGWSTNDWIIVAMLVGFTTGYGVMLHVLIRQRPAFLRQSRAWQWCEAVAIACLMGLMQIAMIYVWQARLV